ncbi:MAG: hypothetical protein ACXVGE_13100 [Blastococcus sp.]
MTWLCPACFMRRHDDCDPLTYWCECSCAVGGLFDPYRIPDEEPE